MTGSDPVDRATATARLREARPVASGTASVPTSAVAGRVVAEPVVVLADVPARGFATMDGFAFAAAENYPLWVVDEVGTADAPPTLEPGEAVRIVTGAPLPDRADAVLPREDATLDGDRLTGPMLAPGTNRYPAGATAAAGEVLFAPGDRLAPRHATLLDDVGVETVTVHERPSVGVLATGTEIHEGEQPDRDSAMLANLVRSWGADPTLLGSVPDDPDRVRGAIEDAASQFDAVLTSGGTSVGDADHVGRVLAGHDTLFRGVRLRPGRPATAALVDGTLVCALPGKPIAAHTAAIVVVRSAFVDTGLPTITVEATIDCSLPDAPFEYAVPVELANGGAEPLGHEDSTNPLYDTRFVPGRVASSTRVSLADGLVLTSTGLSAGNPVQVVPYEVVE